MKKIIILFAFLTIGSLSLLAQPKLPPNDPSNGGNHGPVGGSGGNAPIGSGIALLLGLGAAYGGKKVWSARIKN